MRQAAGLHKQRHLTSFIVVVFPVAGAVVFVAAAAVVPRQQAGQSWRAGYKSRRLGVPS